MKLENNLIASMLRDAYKAHESVLNTASATESIRIARSHLRDDGISFLTERLPHLGKCLDKALTYRHKLTTDIHGFAPMSGSELPAFAGELFRLVFELDGTLRPDSDAQCVATLRQLLFAFYKYELPFKKYQKEQVLAKFERTELELSTWSPIIQEIGDKATSYALAGFRAPCPDPRVRSVLSARKFLWELFRGFDPKDIIPRHGPGAVATKQRLWGKYYWSNVSSVITDYYPFDEYFMCSPGHVCDRWQSFGSVKSNHLPAKVILVPKDSRGPRLISCEPVDIQWIQQGLAKAIVERVESHPLTRWNVRFTDQSPNRVAALYGSSNGRYATLDLNEASDRVSLDLVRLLFPGDLLSALEACRSTATVLPCGRELTMRKFAPMGSACCFPILALTVFSLLRAAIPDAYSRERIYVYGDDVIVPTAQAASAIEQLESFGLKVNLDKSCTSGLFRESCGMDAFKGVAVTPVRFRTVWSSSRSPDVYTSWIVYANSFYDKRWFCTYEQIVSALISVYSEIPDDSLQLAAPSLRDTPDGAMPSRRRFNRSIQKIEWKVYDVQPKVIKHTMDGWSMLLRFFTEASRAGQFPFNADLTKRLPLSDPIKDEVAFSVSSYTPRDMSKLVSRWR